MQKLSLLMVLSLISTMNLYLIFPKTYIIFIKSFIVRKIGYASSLINTEFAILCGDDEFMLVDGLKACVDFLRKNIDYAQCGGASVGINRIGSNLSLYPSKAKQLKHKLSESSPRFRLYSHLQNYTLLQSMPFIELLH